MAASMSASLPTSTTTSRPIAWHPPSISSALAAATYTPSAPAALALAAASRDETPEAMRGQGPGKLPLPEACSLMKLSRSARPLSLEMSASTHADFSFLMCVEKVSKSMLPCLPSSPPFLYSILTVKAPVGFFIAFAIFLGAVPGPSAASALPRSVLTFASSTAIIETPNKQAGLRALSRESADGEGRRVAAGPDGTGVKAEASPAHERSTAAGLIMVGPGGTRRSLHWSTTGDAQV
mmetsp:Transcript_51474/g.128157  ORF Transcript_51474/g.128157 Transcript_51474/m.128157 type:complete len:237 (-) Transcript_51474:7-717(-)